MCHVFLHSEYGKTTIYGRSHTYHHLHPEQVNWLGSPPNLYIYHSNPIIDEVISLFYENTYFYPYASYLLCHYLLYGTIMIALIMSIPHLLEALIAHALIHNNIITHPLFKMLYSNSHILHHKHPKYNYTTGWFVIWDLIFQTLRVAHDK